jgi:thioredoxin reductase (NADPH)
MESTTYDVIVIGAGPSGLAAALYTSRANLSTLVLEKGPTGGQISLTDAVENYPGFPEPESGAELADRMQRQAEKFGAVLKKTPMFRKFVRMESNSSSWRTNKRSPPKPLFWRWAPILKNSACPARKKNVGTGVSYCATCDGAFFRGKMSSWWEAAMRLLKRAYFITRYCNTVTVVHRRDQYTSQRIVQNRAFANKKIKFIWNAVIKEIVSTVKSIMLFWRM